MPPASDSGPEDCAAVLRWNRSAEAFLDGAEFGALTSASTDAEIVEAVFGRVLGRTPDRAGLDYWTNEIAAGRSDRPWVCRRGQ